MGIDNFQLDHPHNQTSQLTTSYIQKKPNMALRNFCCRSSIQTALPSLVVVDVSVSASALLTRTLQLCH